MVDMETARARNKEYEDARKAGDVDGAKMDCATAQVRTAIGEEEHQAYKQFLTPPPGTPSIWGPELQEHIEKGTFCPLTAMRQPNVDLDTYVAKSAYVKAKLHNAYPAKLLTEVPQCQLDMHVSKDVPDDRAVLMQAQKLEPGSWEARVAMLHHMLSLCAGGVGNLGIGSLCVGRLATCKGVGPTTQFYNAIEFLAGKKVVESGPRISCNVTGGFWWSTGFPFGKACLELFEWQIVADQTAQSTWGLAREIVNKMPLKILKADLGMLL